MKYSAEAEQQIDGLIAHYQRKGRVEAVRNLFLALKDAEARIERDPLAGLSAPRPYPHVARAGRSWIKVRRYWVNYTTGSPQTVVAVFFETANIPVRAGGMTSDE